MLAVAALLVWLYPPHRGLVWLGLYTIPSHMLVSPFPHEPLLLYYAKSFSATSCAVASLAGCLVAGMWDYCLFIPLIHHPRVREKYVESRIYKRSVNFFRKSPFWALVIVGLTPIPFYPIKFLSIADGYPMTRYLAALTVGRTPRYYAIAYLGHVLKFPNWSLAVWVLAILTVALYRTRRQA